jgi:hypothetical protein
LSRPQISCRYPPNHEFYEFGWVVNPNPFDTLTQSGEFGMGQALTKIELKPRQKLQRFIHDIFDLRP